jgi:hypothetical protein
VAEASDASPRPRRRGRRIVLAVALLLAIAFTVRLVLTIYAAELFVAALGRALAGTGTEVVFVEPPAVSLEGFESKGVLLRSLAGKEYASADEASGSAHLLLRAPYVSVALRLKGARASWANLQGERGGDEPSASALEVALPPSISRISLEQAKLDFGGGRAVTVDASIVGAAGGSARVEVVRLDYTEPSGERAAEKMAGTLSLERRAGEAPRLDVRIERGAALAGTVLFDFEAHPLTLAANVNETEGRWSFGDSSFALGKLAGGTGSFAVSANGLESADVRLVSGNLEPAFATLVREPFSGIVPALVGSEFHGRGELALEIRAPSRHRTNATATLTLDTLRTRSVEAAGLAIDLPWIGAEQRGTAARSGRLRAKTVSLFGLVWTGVDIPVDATAGRLRARSVQEWKTAGGTMRVADLAYDDDAARGPRVSGDVELAGFDLGALGRALGKPWLSGSLRGRLGRVEIDRDAVRAAGTVDIEAWRGTVTLSRVSIDDPFGRVPELGLDVAVRDVDLETLTKALGYGRVTGVLEGHVAGLVLADGQAQSFDADLHTVRRRGVSQTIDVRAIAQLGALGGDTGSLTGSLLKMIDRYRYSAMGIRCRLRNDVFEIRGVETDRGRDYLVKGSLLPPSVSVVSHSQVISFSEMLRRVDRITALGEEGGSPDALEPQ